ncbi:MAG: BRO family protein [archaeon]
MEKHKKLLLFGNSKIRREWHNNEWYFSVVDIIAALTDSPTPRQYWGKTKDREFIEIETSPIWVQLKLLAEDGKMRLTDCVNRKNTFRLIQSIPSKKAEPFKKWLAQLGEDRLQEIEDPEIGQTRIRELYRKKGYSEEWIGKRMRCTEIREDLTNEWQNRDIQTKKDYAILTNEISKATFGKTVDDYKQHKSLRIKDNLRDHMDELELIFTMLGEKVTTEITKTRDTKGLNECKTAAKDGGKIAGNARRETEKKIGRLVTSNENYLNIPEKEKRKLLEKKKTD